ncbi:hypothetical protein D3C81_1879790 [compost metagenome]
MAGLNPFGQPTQGLDIRYVQVFTLNLQASKCQNDCVNVQIRGNDLDPIGAQRPYGGLANAATGTCHHGNLAP